MERPLATRLPDLGAKQPGGLGDETMLEVGQHDVGIAVGDGVIEGDGPFGPVQRVGQSNLRQRPGVGQSADTVAACTACGRFQFGLAGQLQRDRDHPCNGGRRDAKLFDAFIELLAQLLDVLAKIAFQLQRCPAGPCLCLFDLPIVHDLTPAEHGFLDLLRQHRSGGAQVVANGVDLLGDAPEKIEIAIE